MKTKSMHKGLAVVLAVLMMLALIPLTPFTTKASAAGDKHVFESSKMTAAAAGAYKDAQEVKFDDYFTIYMSAKTKIDSSEKTWADDGYTSPQRLNFGGKGDVTAMKNLVSFKTANPATVKLWFVQGGDDNRQMAIWDANGAQIAATNLTGMAKNQPYYAELKLDKAGTYLLGGATNNNNIYKIEVEEAVAAAAQENTFESSKMTAAAAGAFKDGQEVKFDDFFTIYMSAKTKIDSSDKTWADDGYNSPQRLNFGGKGDVAAMKNLISFKTGAAATVKLWFVQGGDDNRQMAIWDASGAQVAATNLTGMAKNQPYYAELKLDKAGTYFLGGATNNNNIYKVTVVSGGGAAVARGDWSKVAAPSIEGIALNAEDKGKIEVSVKADVSNNGADKLNVTMLDKDGKEVDFKNTVAENTQHTLTFTPKASGKYTFTAKLIREGETDKTGNTKTFDFTLPLGVTTISSVTNKGNGNVLVKWDKVDEATGYVVYAAGKEVKATDTSATVEGLKVGDKVEFTVAAVRGSETGAKSAGLTATITAKEQQEWGFTAYGTSTSSSKNKYDGNLNEGKVTVIAQGGAGKLNLAADDGYSFYYTAVPANKNFTFRAKLHVDEWTYSNGQEGFGIAAVDSLPEKAYDTSHWTNFYMAGVARFDPFKARQGVGVMAKVGITPENWQDVKDNKFDRTKLYAARGGEPLDDYSATADSRYNIVGNLKNPDALANAGSTTVAELVDFDLEITKNNTGFFVSYYKDGKLVKTQKHWGTEDLSKLDKDYIYVGVVAARNFTVSLKNTDYTLEIRDPKNDPKAEPKPIEYVTPSLSIESGVNANSDKYNVVLKTNYKGNVVLKVNGTVVNDKLVVGDKLDSDGNVMETIVPVTVKAGKNTIEAAYTVDPSAKLEEDQAFSKKDAKASVTIVYDTYFAKQDNLYVAPGATKGNGSKESPIDLYTAVKVARPGQKIILTEGTYKLKYEVRVTRGMNGTKDKMIYMIADPEAKTRPVLDFAGTPAIGLHIVGDYWYLQGFDVIHAGNNGLRIDGNNCVADQIHAYYNTGTGISIQTDSKYSRLLWPMNNTIKNCDAYYNADPGEEDADGFSAKFCIGVGNVFDNCVAYGNADDGWDLYGRNYPIEPVTIQNCVTYKNGYREDGSRGKGNGNGFKLGGDNNAARHLLINSVSFMNGADGITCNSSPNVIVKNSISYANDKSGISLYTKAGNTDFESAGVISYKNGAGDSFEGKGSQDVKKVDMTYWNGANGVADNWFKSLNFGGAVKRNADGSINMEGFLELTDKAPKNAGAVLKGVGSANVTVTPDKEVPAEKELDDPAPATGFEPFAVVAIVLAGAGIAVCALKRKKRV